MRSLFGLPAHVFFVHVPLVGIPAVSGAALVMAVRRGLPSWYGWSVAAGAVGMVVATWFTVQSGLAFDDLIGDVAPTEKHESLGKTTLLFAIGLALAVIALAVERRRQDRGEPDVEGRRAVIRLTLSGVTVLLAILATIWVARTGHEGARLVWDGVVPEESSVVSPAG